MTRAATASLASVAVKVGDALRRRGIQGVLTGGACASLYSGGAHQSVDVDLILSGPISQVELDGAMAGVGFVRRRDRYVHPRLPFFVEFPRGPLAIGSDHRIKPVMLVRGTRRALALSSTDSCRDRLAAFYHWNDRQSLVAAVAIAMRHRTRMGAIREWSLREGASDQFDVFATELRAARRLGSGLV